MAVQTQWVVLGALACAACGLTEENDFPPNVKDPANIRTAVGAMGFYRGVLASLPGQVNALTFYGAVVTDELETTPILALTEASSQSLLDSRYGLNLSSQYDAIHKARGQAREARGFLEAYAEPDSSPALRGHLYAVEGYTNIWLADHFCSGIPLSTVDFDGGYTLTAGFTTSEVYQHAVTLFDSAVALTGDSMRFRLLASVGNGRALLALGQYAAAAAAVTEVPDGFAYQVMAPSPTNARFLFDFRSSGQIANRAGVPTVGDFEGLNGLDYRSSGDPRSSTQLIGSDRHGNSVYLPTKYLPVAGSYTHTLASGVEARLIEAEAALQAGSVAWLTVLNALRTDGTFDTVGTDTLWHAGGGGVPGLRPLDDPGTAAARLDLVFRERGFWLFVTGHRQGDLRRLIREYGRELSSVYPTGLYPGYGMYSQEIVASVPSGERERNPKYTGCFHQGA